LTRDYKNYQLAGDTDGVPFEGRLGMSVSVNPVKTVFETFGFEKCFEEIDAYMAEKNLSMYGVSCTVHNADNSVGRFIMLYSHMDDSLAKTLPFLIEKVDSD